MELPRRDPDGTLTNRIGQFAEKHQLMVAYHNHTQANINFWDRAVWQSEYNGLNLDIGHYVAANGPESLMEILDKHWTRIGRSEEHTSELQSRGHLVCRLLLVK